MPGFDPRRIAFIGFGEAGGVLAGALVATGRHDVTAYDILVDQPASAPAIAAKGERLGVKTTRSAAEAACGAAVVISAVTAAAAGEVAREAGSYLAPGQLFLDINSVSPELKRANAAAVERGGARYVEAAVMQPVPPNGLRVPMLLGGPHARALKEILDPAGMVMTIAGAEVGKASAIKMLRSIMIKGLEALTVECLLTARLYGVEDEIIASLDKTFPELGWEKLGGYLIGRVVEHGRRRAAEMREAAATIAETGLAPLMAGATAERHDWVADRAQERPSLAKAADAEWRQTLDALAVLGGLRKLG
jgi:3-hydroxyisobutyrate dehydrogenase-like beta-hydroxyacid dehydrogenase